MHIHHHHWRIPIKPISIQGSQLRFRSANCLVFGQFYVPVETSWGAKKANTKKKKRSLNLQLQLEDWLKKTHKNSGSRSCNGLLVGTPEPWTWKCWQVFLLWRPHFTTTTQQKFRNKIKSCGPCQFDRKVMQNSAGFSTSSSFKTTL